MRKRGEVIDMTIETIKKRIEEIKDVRWDFESAHGMEDRLYTDFIRYVSIAGDKELAEKAHEILKTEHIEFPRYCA